MLKGIIIVRWLITPTTSPQSLQISVKTLYWVNIKQYFGLIMTVTVLYSVVLISYTDSKKSSHPRIYATYLLTSTCI